MNSKLSVIVPLLAMLPLIARAAAEDNAGASSPVVAIFWSILPILVIGFVVWLFFGRVLRKNQKRSDTYIADMKKHNERVEQLLERIANAMENRHD